MSLTTTTPSTAAAGATLADRIEDLLPQTQCTKCGYPGCRPYAEAIAAGRADYNQCPPGGAAGIARLAALLGKPPVPLNPAYGVERPRAVALIDEALCIGCTLCIQACPVDAIVGAAKQMHTVLPDQCTGCDLCVAPCPVDCIAMVELTPAQAGWDGWSQAQADSARQRFGRREQRLQREAHEIEARLAARAAARQPELDPAAPPAAAQQTDAARKKSIIEAAVARARRRREQLAAGAPAAPKELP